MTIISAALLFSRRALPVSAFSTEAKIAAASPPKEKTHAAKRVAIVGAGVSDVRSYPFDFDSLLHV